MQETVDPVAASSESPSPSRVSGAPAGPTPSKSSTAPAPSASPPPGAPLTFTSSVTLRGGLEVPLLGLGTWQLKKEECRDAVAAALRCGYRLLDTAAAYGNEEAVADGISKGGVRREDLVLVTKLDMKNHGDKEVVLKALTDSLQRLRVPFVDIFLIHSPKGGAILSTWDAMLEAKAMGLTKAVGVSNFGAGQLRALAAEGREAPEVNQIELHFALQQRETVAYCSAHGIAVMAYSPIARGRLFGKTGLSRLAALRNRTEAELAIRWCLQKGFITIPKSKDPRRIEANAPFGFSLAPEEMTRISALDEGHQVCKGASDAMVIPWEEIAEEISESDGAEEHAGAPGRQGRRRRRRRPRPGGDSGPGRPGSAATGGTGAARWTDMLTSISNSSRSTVRR